MEHTVRSGLNGVERVLDHLPVVVDQRRRCESAAAVARPTQPQFTRKWFIGSQFRMRQRPGDEDVISADDQSRRFLAIVRVLTRLVDANGSPKRTTGLYRSRKQDRTCLFVFLHPCNENQPLI